MALSISSVFQTLFKTPLQPSKILPLFPSSICISTLKPFSLTHLRLQLQPIVCFAKQQSRSVKPNKKKKKKGTAVPKDFSLGDIEIVEEGESLEELEREGGRKSKRSEDSVPLPLPKPPAGFVVDDVGCVLMVAPHRIATIVECPSTLLLLVDPIDNLPLECMIRRVFANSKGDDCMLLCPVDTPIMVVKSANLGGWSTVGDDEFKSLLPNVAYALAKIHMHLVHSGFCYTARGGFCYSEENIFEFDLDGGEGADGVPTEGVEVTFFHLDGANYMIYTPSDPLLFVAVKDENGQLRIADDDLLDDPAVVSAIDEETEFNAMVEEELALFESLFGGR
ncbi:hypothetical protein Cgig2_022914 [Carnegiea gigantea]|uniref:Uncharacterized protein n=1 Tax=Carnegiea gigantea TaxID=171969 RepID=A0A9Q1KP11_9CARY|nr:hypothetical protein Cgig2_022914 [Carnegiea gigantea]